MNIPILSNIRDNIGDFLSRGYNERQEQKQALIQQAQQQRGRDVQSQLMASGFGGQIGPQVGADPAMQQQLGGIAQGLASPDPKVNAFAREQIGNMQGVMGMNMTPQQQVDYTKSQIELSAMMNPARTEREQNEVVRGIAREYTAQRNAAMLPLYNQQEAIGQMQQFIAAKNDFGDIGAIFGFFKAMDPGSRVTGGEIELSNSASPFLQEMAVVLNRIVGEDGGLMDNPKRARLSSLMGAEYGRIRAEQLRLRDFYDQQVGSALRGYDEAARQFGIEQSRGPYFDPNRQPSPVFVDDSRGTGNPNAGQKVTGDNGEVYTVVE